MNQRFQEEEIRQTSELYAEDELYKAIFSIGLQLEAELTRFGLCPEECFMEVREILTIIAELGEKFSQDLDHLWLRKYNEYRRLDRSVSEDETRKVVGIIFGFVIIAISSSHHPFYRNTLPMRMLYCIGSHDFEGWELTLGKISEVNLEEGWFDKNVIEEENADDGEHKLAAPFSLASTIIIFSSRLFTKETHYEQIRTAIFSFIKPDDSDETKNKYQIDYTIQSEWYYILKAIYEAGVTGRKKVTTTQFLKQMKTWYPSLFPQKNEEDEGKMLRRYSSSISAERNRWITGMEKTEASICDMFAISNARGYDQAKTLRMHSVAEGLKSKLVEIVQSVSSK